MNRFNKKEKDLTREELDIVKKAYPFKLSEAELK